MTTQREHALLSASGAQRWFNCTPSARLEDGLPDSTSDFAAEGTLAHRIAELKLKKAFGGLSTKEFNSEMKAVKVHPLYQMEMLRYTEVYVNHIKGLAHSFSNPPHIAIEQRLDYSHVAPDGFGTGDCIIIGDKNLYIIDFKYGQGVPVNAKNNFQMTLYGLGAMKHYGLLYDLETVTMVVIQPRLDNISEFSATVEDMDKAAVKLHEKALLAYDGKGDFKVGDWCRFCRAGAQCRGRSTEYTALEDFGYKNPNLLSLEEMGDILKRAKNLAKWASDVESYALTQCLAGEKIHGWKAVAGRSIRQFTDVDAAFSSLTSAGYSEAILYDRKPLSLAKLEKVAGKKEFKNLVGEFIFTPEGKPTLAPDTDPRCAITLKTTPEEDFKNESEDK